MGELANAQPLPAHLQQYVQTGKTGAFRSDAGLVRPSDIGVAFLKICQDQSKQSKPNWDNRGAAALPVGSIFETKTHQVIPVGQRFIPLIQRLKFIYWIGKPGDGHMEFACDDPNDPQIKAINGLKFEKDRTGKTLAPLVTEYRNFYVMIPMLDEPAVISFCRTSTNLGKELFRNTVVATRNFQLPLFSLMYSFDVPSTKIEGASQWKQWNIKAAGFTPPEVMERAAEMYETAKMMAEFSSGSEFSTAEDDDGDLQPAQAQVVDNNQPQTRVVSAPVPAPAPQQQTITVQPTVVQAQPAPQQQQVAAAAAAPKKAFLF